MISIIVDSTAHGMPEILVVDLKRHFSSQENLDSVVPFLVDPSNRRKIQRENWDKIVLPLVIKNNLKLPFYRNKKTNFLYLHGEQKSKSDDPYAIAGACNMSSWYLKTQVRQTHKGFFLFTSNPIFNLFTNKINISSIFKLIT